MWHLARAVGGLGVLRFASTKTSKTKTCWHDYQMSEVLWKHSSITIPVIAPGWYRLHIHILESNGCLHSSHTCTTAGHEVECQENVTCGATLRGGCQWVTFNVCVFNKSGWSWAVSTKSLFKLCFQLVTLRITLLDWVLFIWTSYTHSQMTIRCCVW